VLDERLEVGLRRGRNPERDWARRQTPLGHRQRGEPFGRDRPQAMWGVRGRRPEGPDGWWRTGDTRPRRPRGRPRVHGERL